MEAAETEADSVREDVEQGTISISAQNGSGGSSPGEKVGMVKTLPWHPIQHFVLD